MRWRSSWTRLRLPFRLLSDPFPQEAVGLIQLEPIPDEELDPELRALVLHEIGERVYAQLRRHWTQRLVGLAWIVAGVPAAVLLFLFATSELLLLVTFLAGAWAVWLARHSGPVIATIVVVLCGGGFLLMAGAYYEHLHILSMVLVFACAARGAWILLAHKRDLFVVTDQRVLRLWGVLLKNRAVVPLGRILDITVHKPVLGRVFGYGHLVFESAAQEQGLRDVKFMPEPDKLDRTIQILQYGGRPDAPADAQSAAEAAEEIPPAVPADAGGEQTEPYVWGGGGTGS